MRFLPVIGPSFFLSPDPSFNGGKAAQVDYFAPNPDSGRDRSTFQDPATGDFGSSVALQPNGRIVIAGYTFETVGDNTIVANKVTVTRFTGDGASISGTLFNDLNANGNPETTESKVAGRTVYIDANNNGKLDSGEARTLTDATGHFTFGNLQAGSYTIREVLPAGWRQTAPNGNGAARVVNLTVGQSATIMQIGATQAAVITGRFYNDLNRNGVFDVTEKGLANWQAYIDKNNNGVWDKGEYIVTGDSKGIYTMVLQPGTYRIREVRQSAWTRTQPAGAWPLGYYDVTVAAGQLVTARDFGNVLS